MKAPRNWLWKKSRSCKRPAPRRRVRPWLEPLEDRCLLSVATFSSGNVNTPIPDNNASGIFSPLNVGASGIITDVDVTLNMTHTWDSDLDVYLFAPDNTLIKLFDFVGDSGDNFTGTILDDEAAVNIGTLTTAASAPFTGRFRPEQALTAFDGKNMQGTWYLFVRDNAQFDTGTLVNWSLTISTAPVSVGPETLVNTETNDHQYLDFANKQNVAVDAVGNSVVVWNSTGQDGDGLGIYAQRFDAAGNRLGNEFRVNTVTASDQHFASVAMEPDGDFIIVWQSWGLDGSEYNIFYRRYSAAGVPLTASEIQVNNTLGSWQIRPAVAVDAAGNFVITWQSWAQDGSNYGIYARRFNAAGVAQGATEFLVNTTTTIGDQTQPVVAMDAAGNFVIVWESSDGNGLGVFGQRFNAAGNAVGAEFRVNNTTASGQELPSVAMDQDGDFVVVWHTSGQDGSGKAVFARRYNAAGVAQGNEFKVNTSTTNDQGWATVAMDPLGNFLVTWSSNLQDGSAWGIYAQQYSAAGVPLGSEFRVNTTTSGTQENSSVGIAGDRQHIVVAWTGGGPGDTSGYGVFAQWYLDGDVPNTIAQAQPLRVLDDGSMRQAGTIEVAGDQDLYRFTASETGLIKIEQNKAAGSNLDSFLFAYDANGIEIDQDDDSGGNGNSLILLPVVAGQVFFIRAAAFGSSTGAYDLRITPMPDLVTEVTDVVESGAQWGSTITVSYTVRNQGTADSGECYLVPVLSADANINGNSDYLFPFGAVIYGEYIWALEPGASVSRSFQLTLPNAPPAGFPASGNVFLGFIVDFTDVVAELDETNNQNRGAGLDRDAFAILQNGEVEANNDRAHANSILANTTIDAAIGTAGDVDFYRFDITTGGFLDASVTQRGGSTLDSRLELFGVDSFLTVDDLLVGGGGLMVSSDDQAPGNVNPRLRQYLLPGTYYLAGQQYLSPGTYYLAVSSAANGAAATGAYRLTVSFTASANPFNEDVTTPVFAGNDPRAMVVGDFNRDSILDLAVVNRGSTNVSILLGLGEGNFESASKGPFDVPDAPTEIVALDYNNDGRLDLITIDTVAGFATRLPGVGDGNFLEQGIERLPLTDPRLAGIINRRADIPDGGQLPPSRLNINEDIMIDDVDVIVDFEHDFDADLDVFLVGPDGTRIELFSDVTTATSFVPGFGTVSHDFSSVTLDDDADETMAAVSVHERGRFRPAQDLSAFNGISTLGQWSLEVADDTANGQTGRLISWSLIVNGTYVFSNYSLPTVDFDFNRDGTLDRIALVSEGATNSSQLAVGLVVPASDGVTVDLSKGGLILAFPGLTLSGDVRPPEQVAIGALVPDSFFLPTDRSPSDRTQATPLVADLDGDSARDVVIVRENGDIVLRRGVAGKAGEFEPPVLVNADRVQDPAARAVVVAQEGRDAVIVAIDLFTNGLSIYRRQLDGSWQRTPGPDTGLLSMRIAAADLNGDGRKDLVVANAELSTLTFYLAQLDGSFGVARPGGSFGASLEIKLGRTVSDLDLADLNGDGAIDVSVTDPNSGTVGVLLNRKLPGGQLGFFDEHRFRADTGTYGAVEGLSAVANQLFHDFYGIESAFPGQFFTYTQSATSAVASGDFNGDGVQDVVAANRGSNNFSLLLGKGTAAQPLGSYVDPIVVSTGPAPSVIRADFLNNDNFLDVVVLNAGDSTLSIFMGDGQGGFTEQAVRPLAGNAPTGLSLEDIDGDGDKDILVGNRFGDLLIFTNTGNGFFDPYRRTAHHVAISVMDINGDGKDDIVYGNEGLDRVVVRYDVQNPNTVKQELQNRSTGVLAPGAVQLADLNADGLQDLLVANGGGTSLLVYLGIGNGQFGARQEFFVGTNPAGITVADLNNDQILDAVVANRGSNDVSILLGQGQGASWTFTNGQRLDVGGGPVSTAVADVTGDGNPDIFVSNQQDGTVTQLTGTGNGFFNDQNAPLFPVGVLPGNVFVGNFNGTGGPDLVTVNAGSNNITLIPNLNLAATINFSSQGVAPVAGLVRDFNGDGISDLAVANNADGVVALLLGGADGFTLNATFDASGTNPTALAENGNVLYVGHEGEQVLTFNLSFGEPAGDAGGGANRSQVTTLAPLQGGGLAVVVTLRTAGNFGPREGNPEFFAEDTIGLLVLVVAGDAGLELDEKAAVFDADFIELLVGAEWSRLYDEEQPVIVFIIGLEETEDWLRTEAQRRLEGQSQPPSTTKAWHEMVDGIVRSSGLSETATTAWQTLQQAAAAVPEAIRQAAMATWEALAESMSSGPRMDPAPPMEASSAEPMAELPPPAPLSDRSMPFLTALLVPVVGLLGPWFPTATAKMKRMRQESKLRRKRNHI